MARESCFIIAEAGVNHDGDLNKALDLVDLAADAGADAVKFQTFSADRLVTTAAQKAEYQQRVTDPAESQYAMLKRLELSDDAHRVLLERARERGIEFLSTPFDEASCDFLDNLGICRFKVPSGELTNLPYLRHLARKGRPLILSTGMATLGEVERALDVVRGAGAVDVVVLHCTSSYPTHIDDVNLLAMVTMRAAFGVPTGYSDHTIGIEISLAAAALGAVVLEKHITLDASAPGPDHAASLEPAQLHALVRGVRNIERSLGDGVKRPTRAELEVARAARKSIVAARAIAAGQRIEEGDLTLRRAGYGLGAEVLPIVVGRKVRGDVSAGEVLELDDLE
jgi:N-acetylneuraminate synthase